MKKIMIISLCLSLILTLSGSYVFAAEIKAASHINRVTVYPRSALINRTTTLKLNPGSHKVIFSNIIPKVDENSLRVSAEGTAIFKLFGAQVKKEFLKEVPSERIKELKEKILKLEDNKRNFEDKKKILSEKKQFLDSIRLFSQGQIPEDLITKIPSIKELAELLEFLDTKLKENYSRIMEIELSIRGVRKEIEVLKRELAHVSGPAKKLKRSIVVELDLLKPGSLNLDISYLVRGTSWQPLYDARADFKESKVELASYGIVRQKTGEEWPDVELSLSTAKPAMGGRMPYVNPWFLRPYQPIRKRKAVGSLKAPLMQHEAFDKEEKTALLEKVSYARAEEKGVAVLYKLSRKATVKSDGSNHKLPISSQILTAKFEYSTYPRSSAFAYLGSRVKNRNDLQLLSGRVNVFLAGDFVGTSSIDNIGPGQEFDLYLGLDENVKVKRDQIQKKVDDVLIGGIRSSNKKTTYQYKLMVENYKSRKIKVNLFEAMPVSQHERIKVKIKDVSLQPKEKDWKDRKGIWRWELELAPGAKQEIFYTFIIDHPRDMKIGGL